MNPGRIRIQTPTQIRGTIYHPSRLARLTFPNWSSHLGQCMTSLA